MHSCISNVPDILLPPCDDEYQIVLFLERGPEWRQSVKNKARKKKPNGHVFLALRGKKIPTVVITYEPKYLKGNKVPNDKLPPPGEEGLEVPDMTNQSLLSSLLRIAMHFEGFKQVKGEVSLKKDHDHVQFDTAQIFPISEKQYRTALQKIKTDREKPQIYQLVGFNAYNCVAYTRHFLESIGIDVPPLWKILPWPCAVSLSLGFDNVMKEIFGLKPDKRTPVTSRDIRKMQGVTSSTHPAAA